MNQEKEREFLKLVGQLTADQLIKMGWTHQDNDTGSLAPPKGMGSMSAETQYDLAHTQAMERAAFLLLEPHWHEFNPWNDSILYVPLDELAQCISFIDRPVQTKGGEVSASLEFVLNMWSQYGEMLDGYILTGRTITGGVRYGPDGSDYLSPGFSLPKLWALKQKYEKLGATNGLHNRTGHNRSLHDRGPSPEPA